ncbi:MAG: helix-turn-helix transcriptional regulator [Magnetococcales bacterium]|nr:helix-turn-helix transcriptional regulator [Magnetococcales bacterium]
MKRHQTIEGWIQESPENERALFQEDYILEVTEGIWEQMELKQVSKKELADKLGKSKAYITQILNGSRNMTLRTQADIAFALGVKPGDFLDHISKTEEQSKWIDNDESLIIAKQTTNVVAFRSPIHKKSIEHATEYCEVEPIRVSA